MLIEGGTVQVDHPVERLGCTFDLGGRTLDYGQRLTRHEVGRVLSAWRKVERVCDSSVPERGGKSDRRVLKVAPDRAEPVGIPFDLSGERRWVAIGRGDGVEAGLGQDGVVVHTRELTAHRVSGGFHAHSHVRRQYEAACSAILLSAMRE